MNSTVASTTLSASPAASTSAKPAKPVAPASATAAAPAKPAKKSVAKPVKPAAAKTRGTAKQAATQSAKAATPAPSRDAKAKKPKLVRDSFTIPKDEYAVIEALKARAAALAQPVKKSELLRAGLKVLAVMSDAALRRALQAVPSIKTGRPKAEIAPESVVKAPAKAARK